MASTYIWLYLLALFVIPPYFWILSQIYPYSIFILFFNIIIISTLLHRVFPGKSTVPYHFCLICLNYCPCYVIACSYIKALTLASSPPQWGPDISLFSHPQLTLSYFMHDSSYTFSSFLNIVHSYLLALKGFSQLIQFYTSLYIILHSFSFLLEFTIFLAPNKTYLISYHSSKHSSKAVSSNRLIPENLLPYFFHCTTVCLFGMCILLHYMIL